MRKTYDNCTPVILAAGKGTRMHSKKPKVLHTLLGEPMLAYAILAMKSICDAQPVIVIGHCAEAVRKMFPDENFALQAEQKGTGHALLCAMSNIPENQEYILVLNGDAPLITTDTLEKFLHTAWDSDLAFATLTLDDPGAYGRVYRKNGIPQAIIEAKDYDAQTHGPETGEINAGLYLIKTGVARKLLPQLQNNNKSGEYYITDLVMLACSANYTVRAVNCGQDKALLGVNSPLELAQAEDILQQRSILELLDKGVIIHNPQQARISPFASVEPGAEISGPCLIYGDTEIKSGAVIESFSHIKNSVIAEEAQILPYCHLEGATVNKGARVGPYARLRPGAWLGEQAHVGNFVELKNTHLGNGSKANHLSYLGDSEIGTDVNIGAGTITCNYDGKNKHRTRIGHNAFIGSNTALVAPVCVGAGALVGAGSVITKNVPANELGIARATQKNLPLRKP